MKCRSVLPTCSLPYPRTTEISIHPRQNFHYIYWERHSRRQKRCACLPSSGGMSITRPTRSLMSSTLHRLHFNTADTIVQTSILEINELQCLLFASQSTSILFPDKGKYCARKAECEKVQAEIALRVATEGRQTLPSWGRRGRVRVSLDRPMKY